MRNIVVLKITDDTGHAVVFEDDPDGPRVDVYPPDSDTPHASFALFYASDLAAKEAIFLSQLLRAAVAFAHSQGYPTERTHP